MHRPPFISTSLTQQIGCILLPSNEKSILPGSALSLLRSSGNQGTLEIYLHIGISGLRCNHLEQRRYPQGLPYRKCYQGWRHRLRDIPLHTAWVGEREQIDTKWRPGSSRSISGPQLSRSAIICHAANESTPSQPCENYYRCCGE